MDLRDCHELIDRLLDGPRPPRGNGRGDEAVVDVLVWPWGGLGEVLHCLGRIFEADVTTPFAVAVVDDGLGDPSERAGLARLSDAGLVRSVQLRAARSFPARRLRNATKGRDLILLSSDAKVQGDWLDRLRATAGRAETIGAVSPFGDNEIVRGYPTADGLGRVPKDVDADGLDRHCARRNAGKWLDVPVVSLSCVYVKRPCLEAIRLAAVSEASGGLWPRSKAIARVLPPWRAVLAADTFVGQSGNGLPRSPSTLIEGGVLAGPGRPADPLPALEDHLAADPARTFRRNVDVARLGGPGPAFLFLSHAGGGGTERHIRGMADALEREAVRVLVLRPIGRDRVRVERFAVDETPNLEFDLNDEYWSLVAALRSVRVEHAHVQHVMGLSRTALKVVRDLNVSYDWTIHDYYTACPRVHMIDERGTYCGEPEPDACNRCLAKNGAYYGHDFHAGTEVRAWRDDFGGWLTGARRVFVPHADVGRRLARYFPDVRFVERRHFDEPANGRRVAAPRLPGEPFRVAVIGAIGLLKGSEILLRCAEDARDRGLPIRFEVIGFTDRDAAFSALENVAITGEYREAEVFDLLESRQCHAAWLPTVVPETYSYVLSTAFSAGLFPIAFNLGAQAARIREVGWGALVPLGTSPEAINDQLLALGDQVREGTPPVPTAPTRYASMLADYYDLPAPQGRSAIPPPHLALSRRAAHVRS